MSKAKKLSKQRKVAGWVLTGLLALIFVSSAISKLIAAASPAGNAYQKFNGYGLEDWIVFIGLGELIAIVAFIFPRTSSLAVLLLSAHLGGAIVTHMEHGESFVFQAALLVTVWGTQWLRDPNMLYSFHTSQTQL